MSAETLVTIISVISSMFVLAFMISRGNNKLRDDMESKFREFRGELKEFRGEVREEFKEVREELKEFRGEVHEEFKEVRADIAAVNERLSHTDGLVEGLSRALLKTHVA